MHGLAVAQFPQSSIRLIPQRNTSFADAFEPREHAFGVRVGDALVEKDLSGCQDHTAVAVVLNLGIGMIADAHGPHATVAGQMVDDTLVQALLLSDTEDRLQVAAIPAGDQVGDVEEVALHGSGRAQTVERLHDIVGVAQPAEAVVPISLGTGGFGDGGGHSGD